MDIFVDARRVKGLLADSLQNEHKGKRGLLLQILDMEILKRMLQGHAFRDCKLNRVIC